MQQQKEELCAQIGDLSSPLDLSADSVPELKRHVRDLEMREREKDEEIKQMTTKLKKHEQVHQHHTHHFSSYTLKVIVLNMHSHEPHI